MGKGTINSHIGDGQYSVLLDLDTSRIIGWIAELTAAIAAWTARIAAMDPGTEKNMAILEKTALEKRKAYLQSATPADETVTAWCADLTEDLSGSVGTIEVPGERGTVLVQPGYDGNAAYNSARDGQLQPVIASSPAQAFYNLAMLPGWQKWKPTYRFGTITDIDYDLDTCDVTLEAATSTAQGLDVNQEPSLSGVPVDYMDCNSAAFETGDSVVVEFEGQDFESPKVIGFKTSPKPCGWRFKLTRGDGSVVTDLFSPYFEVYNSSGGYLETTEAVYNPSTEYWSFNFVDPEDEDPAGHHVFYDCDDAIYTQYPYRYKYADQNQPADLIPVSSYEDTIPYWVTTSGEGDERDYTYEGGYTWADTLTFPDGYGFAHIDTGFLREGFYNLIGVDVSEIKFVAVTVKSSVAYEIRFNGNPKTLFPNSNQWIFYADGVNFLDEATYTLTPSGGSPHVIEGGEVGFTDITVYGPSISGTQHSIKLEPDHNAGYKLTAIQGSIASITVDYDY